MNVALKVKEIPRGHVAMFDPYHRWLAIPRDAQPPTYYALLGISRNETDPDVIREAAIRQTTHLRTYQSGPYATECAKLLNEVAEARRVLLDPVKRAEYDERIENDTPVPQSHTGRRDSTNEASRPESQKPEGTKLSLEDSLNRVLADVNEFGSLFYFTIFLQQYPEIADYFRGVDFQRQPARLLASLVLVVHHYRKPSPATDLYFRDLGRQHHALRIPVHFYESFRDALLETFERIHQHEWHEALAEEWRQAVNLAAESMLKG